MNKKIISFLLLMLFSISCSGLSSISPQYSGQIFFIADTFSGSGIFNINMNTFRINLLVEADPYQISNIDVTQNGKKLMYFMGNLVKEGNTTHILPDIVYLANSDGTDKNIIELELIRVWDSSFSPDGEKLLVVATTQNGHSEVFTANLDGTSIKNLSQHPDNDIEPAWSPDGSKIAFASNRNGNYDIFVMNADGSNPVNLTCNSSEDREPAWSPDGSKIAFVSNRDGNNEIYVINVDGSDPINLTNHPAEDTEPAWSPDGHYIAYVSEEDLIKYIHIMSSDGSGRVLLIENRKIEPFFTESYYIYDNYSPVWIP